MGPGVMADPAFGTQTTIWTEYVYVCVCVSQSMMGNLGQIKDQFIQLIFFYM